MNPEAADPGKWADAMIRVANSPGVYMIFAALVIFIVCKWPPWRKGEK